ncbi:MAG TPA: cytochrome P450 [Micromonosporaceae bacterium]|nr:cytochrome P450 [Micromonosporaceae bacterium]
METGDPAETLGELFAGTGLSDPYPLYERLRAHGPLVRVQDRFFVATGYEVIDQMLRDDRMLVGTEEVAAFYGSTSDDWLDLSLLHMNPPDHTRLRRLVAGAFTARRVATMRDAIAGQAQRLCGYLAEVGRGGEPVDFLTEFAYPLPIRVICALLGVPYGDSGWIREQAAAMTVALEPSLMTADLSAAAGARRQLSAYFEELIAKRRESPADDLTTALVQVHDSDGSALTKPELVEVLVLLLVAGFETTANLLGNGLHLLLTRAADRQRLRADPGLATNYVEEMLRFDSPVSLTSRYCREETTYGAVTLPPYSQVVLLLAAGNRDPAVFDRPGDFDPDRVPLRSLAFGGGAHYCLGAALARLEAQIAFPMLLDRLPGLTLAGEPQRRPRLVLRGFEELPVTLG